MMYKPALFRCILIVFVVISSSEAFVVRGFTMDRDIIIQDSSVTDSLVFIKKLRSINQTVNSRSDSVNIYSLETKPIISIQEALKGNVTGLLINNNSGEPGVNQEMIVRGLKMPLFYKSDSYSQQPLVLLDGIPLISDHPFVYDIKKYDYSSIGPGTNYLANIDMDNIHSLELIKDPSLLVQYGPLGVNGVILITSKQPVVGRRQISVNSYLGTSFKDNITPVNGDYENRFRSQFYHKFGDYDKKLNYAGYLRDSTNTDYYGPTNWHNNYYTTSFLQNTNLSISGGSSRANFRFYGGVTTQPGAAEKTNLNRYNGVFYINMVPFEWFTMSSMLNVTRLDRDRNKSLRDRYSETGYLPDVSTPLPPGGVIYSNYLNEFNKAIDDNLNNMIKGYISLRFDLMKDLFLQTRFSFDYNQSIREVFWPSTIMEKVNFVSNYFGYNQRTNFENTLNYKFSIEDNKFTLKFGQGYWSDKNRYNYSTGYDGPSDFIKINEVNGNASESGYLSPSGFLTYRYTDGIAHRLSSFYGNVDYAYKDIFTLGATLRRDGSSNRRPDIRWYTSGGMSARLNLLSFSGLDDIVDRFWIGGSYSRVGETFLTDQYAYGPQYRTDLGWEKEPAFLSYNGFATVSRPYSTGWVGYDIRTPYSDKIQLDLNTTLLHGRLDLDVNLYHNKSKDLALLTNVANEYGYNSKVSSGMEVLNKGVEVQLSASPIRSQKFNWKSSLLFSYNNNKLTGLPGGLQTMILGDRKLVVGKSLSSFWLYENIGEITSLTDIPRNSQGVLMNFNGIPLSVGDPLWNDNNNDNIIDSRDKTLKGEAIAPYRFALNNTLNYKKWNLDFQFIAHAGNKILNTGAAKYYDFINMEESNSMNSIKEIFHWQQDYRINSYPIYNPWSSVVPYKKDQDLFLESGAFVKLRSITLGYDISNVFKRDGKDVFNRLYVYGTGMNLFTISKFSGKDPEFITLNGEYDGYGMPMPKLFVLGFKIDL